METHVIIPVRMLKNVKSRLSSVLTEDWRRKLNLRMLLDVLNSVREVEELKRTVVVSPDLEVLRFSRRLGFEVLHEEAEKGVNEAVFYAIKNCVKNGASAVLILPSDVPLVSPEDLVKVLRLGERNPSVVVSPSARLDGTNALLLNPPNVISTFYEQNSFFSHVAEALRKKVKVGVYVSRRLMLDVDNFEDLTEFLRVGWKTCSHRFLREVLKFGS